jgi:acetoin utilization deacetylase AcuC-like enzyme
LYGNSGRTIQILTHRTSRPRAASASLALWHGSAKEHRFLPHLNYNPALYYDSQSTQGELSMSILPLRLVYSDQARLPIGDHVFHSGKYRAVLDRLLQSGAYSASDVLDAPLCRDEDVLLAHTRLWTEKLKNGTLSAREELELEVPYSKELVDAFWRQAGGSIVAAVEALRNHCCVHIGGGFHHAFADHGEGFCVINDVAIAIRRLQRDGQIARAMVVDCDVHQGNGTAAIFGTGAPEPFPQASWAASLVRPSRAANVKTSAARDVFTVSLHQESNYPYWKPPSSIDVNLPDNTTDAEYLEWLEIALKGSLERFAPELLCYVAGADPYQFDQLGGLSLTFDGLKQRDLMVFSFARDHGIPVMSTFAGGYAENPDDTVTIHTNTVLAAKEVFGPSPAQLT